VLVVLVKDGVRQGVAEEEVAVGAQAAERLIATNERVATKVVFDRSACSCGAVSPSSLGLQPVHRNI
jgi:hypothetical protein